MKNEAIASNRRIVEYFHTLSKANVVGTNFHALKNKRYAQLLKKFWLFFMPFNWKFILLLCSISA